MSEEIEFHGWLGKKKCRLPPPGVFFWNSPELKAQVRYDNEYIDGLLSLPASIFKGVYISSDQI